MNLKEMSSAEIREKMLTIKEEMENETDPEKVKELGSKMRSFAAELQERAEVEAEKNEMRKLVAEGKAPEAKTVEKQEERKMPDNMEIRNSKEYIDAYAEYIKTEDPTECRALLTENVAEGTIPVPDLVVEEIKTAWDREGIMKRVKKSYAKGNLKVGFEISGDDAHVHTEGSEGVAEEELVEGIVELVPSSIKKWISISDEAMDMRGEAFLRYIYDEIAYKIAKKAANRIIAAIEACGSVSTTTCPAVPVITSSTITMGLVANAISELSDEAARPIIMMNKLTWAKFKAVQYANGYGADPFEGLEVEFNNTITAFDAASTGDTYLIVGDLYEGALANMPNGEEITFKFDDKTLMTADLIRVLGRLYSAEKVVAPKAFVRVEK